MALGNVAGDDQRVGSFVDGLAEPALGRFGGMSRWMSVAQASLISFPCYFCLPFSTVSGASL